MKLSTSFSGGNALFSSSTEERVTFAPDFRDSERWFYWAFEVTGAAGKTVTFQMENSYVGYHGAAVSHDLITWEWTFTASQDLKSFTYTFGDMENKVYFAHHMLYLPHHLDAFAKRNGLPLVTCATDKCGTLIPYLEVGKGENVILLAARHHACEGAGSYVLEGFVEGYLNHPLANHRLVIFPFVDADGVHHGDQGKNRVPHDHNQDYIDEPLYPGVKAVQKALRETQPVAVFDFHSPWHNTGRNDTVFVVQKPTLLSHMQAFATHFEKSITADSYPYHKENDIAPYEDWNKCLGTHTALSTYSLHYLKDVDLVITLENTYFGTRDCPVTTEKLRHTGACMWQGYLSYLANK